MSERHLLFAKSPWTKYSVFVNINYKYVRGPVRILVVGGIFFFWNGEISVGWWEKDEGRVFQGKEATQAIELRIEERDTHSAS